MNPFKYSKAFTDFLTSQGQTMMRAQEQASMALAQGMQAVALGKSPLLPGMLADLATGAAELANASRALTDLWSAATAVCGTIAENLPAAFAGAPGSPDGKDAIAEATFRKMLDPKNWAGGPGEMDDALSRMAEGPRFADLWEAERRYAGVLRAWMNVRRTGFEHNAVVLEAWVQAGRRFSEHLTSRTDTPRLDARAALALWIETANQQLLEAQRSEPFLKTQAAMIRAATDLRLAQQDMVEHFGKQYGFPTRTELDDVHRTVTGLRRELRAMRRELATAGKTSAPRPLARAKSKETPK